MEQVSSNEEAERLVVQENKEPPNIFNYSKQEKPEGISLKETYSKYLKDYFNVNEIPVGTKFSELEKEEKKQLENIKKPRKTQLEGKQNMHKESYAKGYKKGYKDGINKALGQEEKTSQEKNIENSTSQAQGKSLIYALPGMKDTDLAQDKLDKAV